MFSHLSIDNFNKRHPTIQGTPAQVTARQDTESILDKRLGRGETNIIKEITQFVPNEGIEHFIKFARNLQSILNGRLTPGPNMVSFLEDILNEYIPTNKTGNLVADLINETNKFLNANSTINTIPSNRQQLLSMVKQANISLLS